MSHRRDAALAAGTAAAVLLTGGCTGPSGGSSADRAVLVADDASRGTPFAATVAATPVWLLLPPDWSATGREGGDRVVVRDDGTGVTVVVLALDVEAPPAAALDRLRQDPSLAVTAAARLPVGRRPALVVDVRVVGPPTDESRARGLGDLAPGDVARLALVQSPDGRLVAVRVTAPAGGPEEARRVWAPVLDSLVLR